jgi:hypothetical protein
MKETLFVLCVAGAIGAGATAGIFVTSPLNAKARYAEKPQPISGAYALRGVMVGADEENGEVIIQASLPYPSAQSHVVRIAFDNRTLFRSQSGEARPGASLIEAEFLNREVYVSMERSAEGTVRATLISLRFADIIEETLPQ